MTDLGIKNLTVNNWLEPDEPSKIFVRISSDGQPYPMTGDECANVILEPNLLETVPLDIRRLFEVTRGAMVYSYFFYPMWTLAVEQLFRVAEAAISHKCQAKGAPASKDTLKKKIDWLIEVSEIPESERTTWNWIREARNWASHLETQTILTPSMAIQLLEAVTERINSLFRGG
ncbi:hypothetical protein TFLX_06718 [Thermoflexales bacterium]|nr:hypothetical protein TFLX_06718 [Thermoflexales bacterium]